MMGRPLDFNPGTDYDYSNFGYCVLGRVIEAVSRRPYHEFVSQEILTPLGIRGMRSGKNLLADRAPGEVKYYDGGRRTGRAICGPMLGQTVPSRTATNALNPWIPTAVGSLRPWTWFDSLPRWTTRKSARCSARPASRSCSRRRREESAAVR